ncbi:four-carbon acid sugar kinase family protein [Pseudonocardia sp.]|uniref:four-carbon acid sugar kinase family protein n=1 Tax=Pseudonocardia sp. TaxID=60912 RepID=UPI0031FC8B78
MASAGAVRRLAVVADDLTGAADAAAPFAARGLAVSVALSPADPAGVEVLALLTDNRRRPAAEAAERMRAAVARVRDWAPETLFVKIDSTLRGQVHADVSGALDAWGGAGAVVTPAFPAQGRTVRGGALVVHGETTVVRIEEHFPAGARVVDAETHDDLVALARRILDGGCVAVGSGGLSRALAAVLVDPPRPALRPRTGVTGVLVVVGTPHAVTRAQVAALREAGAALVVAGPYAAEAAGAALRAGRRVVLTCEVDGEVEPESPAAAALAEKLAAVVSAVLEAVPAVGLVLTGGATALAVATALGATEVRLLAEVAEGLPLGELVMGDRRVPVVTKSGGFGARDALWRAAEALEACV